MKKKDLKKLALMGITGGVLTLSQSPLNASEGLTTNILAASCGGKTSCGGSTADNNRNQGYNSSEDSSTYYNNQGSYSQNQGSGSNRQPSRQNQGSCSNSRPNSSSQGSCSNRNDSGRWGQNPNFFADNDDQTNSDNSKPLTESEFKAKLSPQAKTDFDKLTPEAKAKAIKMASHDCSGKNDCKGQNSCKSDKNSCAGQGGCQGQSKCAMTPEQAVKASSMKDKRTSLNNSSSTNNYR
jgi:hypothetical protein